MPSSLAILVIIVVLLCTGTYVQYATTVTSQKQYSSVIPLLIKTPAHLPPVPKTVIPAACKNVDFQWLGSDRSFWDGWGSKSMFMRKDGKFTRKNVRIMKGESICVAVLLGPIPAVSSIQSMLHYAPSDSIVMTARGQDGTLIPITLHQHDKQTNAYFAAVKFAFEDKYSLETSVEYRSYFWEQPQFHKYLPNRFLSRNSLTVTHNKSESTSKCDLIKNPFQLEQSVWMDKQHYQSIDPIGYEQNQFNFMDPVFIPACQLDSVNDLDEKVIHIWGDEHLKRNIQYLNGDTESCNNHGDQELPSTIKGAAIYLGNSLNSPTADIVLLGTGSQGSRQTPNEFATEFNTMLVYLTQQVYTRNELIIVKTNQYIGSSHTNGLTYGKSQAYANIIRSAVLDLNQDRVLLWDTHQIGLSQNQLCEPNIIHIENTILLNIIHNNAT